MKSEFQASAIARRTQSAARGFSGTATEADPGCSRERSERSDPGNRAEGREGDGRSGGPGGSEEQLVQKLRRIEALHARAGSEGEREAADRARQRIRERLRQIETSAPPIEYRFSLSDPWSRHLFVALLRRYGLTPYRYRGQRRTTVMVRLSREFLDDTLWPEFQELQRTLAAYFDALTDRVIEQALDVKAGEPEERPAAPQLQPVDHQASLL